MTDSKENPYLAHHKSDNRGSKRSGKTRFDVTTGGSDEKRRKKDNDNSYSSDKSSSSGGGGGGQDEILSIDAALNAVSGTMNPIQPNKAYSQNYLNILKKRKELPVYAQRQELLDLVRGNQITLFIGETGSGKTTQVPQFLVYDLMPHLQGKQIACTQPRRVAAMSVAERVAKEMDVSLGDQVGYTIRFEDCTKPSTILKYVKFCR